MIAELNDRVVQMSESITALQNHCRNEAIKLNAMESAIPERVHKVEERQAGQVELVNQMSTYTNVQLDAMNKRMNALEELLNINGTRPGLQDLVQSQNRLQISSILVHHNKDHLHIPVFPIQSLRLLDLCLPTHGQDRITPQMNIRPLPITPPELID